MTDNQKKLLDILYNSKAHQEYFSSGELSGLLNVSSRQLRKYIAGINAQSDPPLIRSGHRGYQLDMEAYRLYHAQPAKLTAENPKTRSTYIIQCLIRSQDGYDVFDLGDELYVSPATIESDLKSIRHLLSTFELSLQRDHDRIWLAGSENNKRLLIQHLLSTANYNRFILKDQLDLLSYQYHHQDMCATIRNIFLHNDIFANDYTLNNTILHLMIMIDRIRNGYSMQEEAELAGFEGTPQYQVALDLKDYLERDFSIAVNAAELHYLILIVSNNTTEINYSSINASNISLFVEEKYIRISRDVLLSVEAHYCLGPFDDDFFVNFTLHIKNLFHRIEKGYEIRNPLTKMTKTAYPLIYDIAVFIALEFKEKYGAAISEDEIAFLAFHLGSYFENNHHNKINCIFIYIDYYSAYQRILDKIMQQYADYLYIKSAISVHNYDPETVHTDLILSMADIPFACEHIVLNPILQDTDYHNIDHAIKKISLRKKAALLSDSLPAFFHEKLFFKDVGFGGREAAIEFMCGQVTALGLADDSLCQNVLAREHMSSTAFGSVAVPHSLARNARHNFICVAICREPVEWTAGHDVRLIVLIGISKEDRSLFSDIFQELVNIFSNPSHVKELLGAADREDFIRRLTLKVRTQ